MTVSLPTVERFNQWDHENKRLWLLFETGGKYSEPNIYGFIFYDKHNMVIRYKVNERDVLTEATAMNLLDGLEAFKQFKTALKATLNKN